MFENVKYTLAHKKAFLKVEKSLTGKNTIRGYLHDVDKLFLYLVFTKRRTSKIHRWWSKHHMESFWKSKDFKQAVIDWECSRYTKPSKVMNARETMEKYYSEYKKDLIVILDKFEL